MAVLPLPATSGRNREKPSRRLGDVHAVATVLDCSPAHVRRMADDGRLVAPLKVGSLVRWDMDAIDRWLADGCPRVDRRAAK